MMTCCTFNSSVLIGFTLSNKCFLIVHISDTWYQHCNVSARWENHDHMISVTLKSFSQLELAACVIGTRLRADSSKKTLLHYINPAIFEVNLSFTWLCHFFTFFWNSTFTTLLTTLVTFVKIFIILALAESWKRTVILQLNKI